MTDLRRRILVVDDEPTIRESLQLILKRNFDVEIAEDGESALTVIENFSPDLILLDVMMPRLDGLETLRRLRENQKAIPVVMLTAVGAVQTAVTAMKYGARDFINKPVDIDQLTTLIVNILDQAEHFPMPYPVTPLTLTEGEEEVPLLIGNSQAMRNVLTRVQQVAERDTTVLVTGESGTGKELVARLIHRLSPRSKGPFVPINCGAIPETLIESELFGHERGAFTNAVERRIGHCELSDKGTLFLDEIGELSHAVQVKILRFLQEHEFYRLGRSKPIRVDSRIVAATNRNLEEAVASRIFRSDLYYRIHVVNIEIPPLRDRFEDIPILLDHFLRKLGRRYAGRALEFSSASMDALIQYEWPGNIRELENVIESLMALSPVDKIEVEHLPRRITNNRRKSSEETITPGALQFQKAERDFETDIILKALKKSNYIQTRAAELLGISRRILKYKMDKLGISDRPPEEIPLIGEEDGTVDETVEDQKTQGH